MDASATLTLSLIPHVGEDPADGVARDPARSDGELMRAVAGGDPDAFALLYGRYERPLYNFLVRLTRQRALAEDLLQETFTRVWRAAGTWDPGRGPTRAWLYKVALNAARSELGRKVHRTPHVSLDDETLPPPDRRSDERELAGRLDQLARGRAVARALDELPGFMKEVVVLRCQEQLSFAEIGEVTGTPIGTLKSRFHRAVEALRARVADEKDTHGE